MRTARKKSRGSIALGVIALWVFCLNCSAMVHGAAPAPPRPADGDSAANVRVTAPPVPVPTRSPLDSEPIRRGGSDGGGGSSIAPHSQGLELSRVGAALALVIGLIFGLRWLARRLFQPNGAGRSSRAIQVLARSPVAPRQNIVLLRVGRRVIVVGESGAQMNSLCEITDADEIAALVGQLQDEKSSLPSRAFGTLFHRAKQEIGGAEDDEPAEDSETSAMPDPSTAETADDPAISDTREEISGLMDRIRTLTTHFRNGPA